jgi:O-antigen/teichoic acid export membrane protein
MAKKQEKEAKEYFTSVLLVMCFLIVVIFAGFEYFGDALVKVTFPKSNFLYHPYFRLSLLAVIFGALYQTPQVIFKSLQMAKHFFAVSVIILFSTILFNMYFLVVKQLGVYGIFLGTALGALVGAIMAFWFIRDWFCFKFKFNYVTQALSYSLPIIPHMLGTYIFTMSNRIILEKYVNMTDIGLFSIADRIASVPLFLVSAFNLAYNPEFIQMAENDKKKAVEYNYKVIEIWWAGVIFLVLGFTLFSDHILRIMATEKFYPAVGVATVLAIACVFRGLYCFAISPVFFYKKTYWVPVVTITAGIVSIVLNILIIPVYGIIGAAWVTVASYFVTFVMAEIIGRSVLKLEYPLGKMISIGLTGLVIFMIVKRSISFFNFNGNMSFFISIIGVLIFGLVLILLLGKKYVILKNMFLKNVPKSISQDAKEVMQAEESALKDIGDKSV